MSSDEKITTPQVSLEKIREIIKQEEVPWLQKKKLIKQEFRAVAKQRKDQIDAILRVERTRTAAIEEAAKKQVYLDKEVFVLQIRKNFVDIMSDLEITVDMNTLNFLTEFGKQLTKFKKELERKDIEEDWKNVIRKKANDSFARVSAKLEIMAADLIAATQETDIK